MRRRSHSPSRPVPMSVPSRLLLQVDVSRLEAFAWLHAGLETLEEVLDLGFDRIGPKNCHAGTSAASGHTFLHLKVCLDASVAAVPNILRVLTRPQRTR